MLLPLRTLDLPLFLKVLIFSENRGRIILRAKSTQDTLVRGKPKKV
jgi:hypothetical protein